jgi:hypothetical protein
VLKICRKLLKNLTNILLKIMAKGWFVSECTLN